MKNPRYMIWLHILTMSVLVFTTATGQRSTYGEVCNKNKRCDKTAWLACISGKCDCVKPDEMIFNPETNKCAARAGERCKYVLDSDGEKRYEEISCVDNAECSSNGFCACAEDFYENFNGSCSGKGLNSDACNDTIMCSNKKGFICTNGICQCEQSKSVFSSTHGQCLGLVTHVCINGKCTEGSDCIKEECTCGENFYSNSEDRCQPRLNRLINCTADIQCKNEGGYRLKCLQGICECDPDISIFGTAFRHYKSCGYSGFRHFTQGSYSSHCLGKVGNPCIEGRCATGSYCAYEDSCNDDNLEGICSCTPNTSPSLYGICGKWYLDECSSTKECLDEMACTRGRCECRYSNPDQTYDRNRRRCLNAVGMPCGKFSICTEGAACKTLENSLVSTCECRQGYVDDDGTCKMESEKVCAEHADCYMNGGLACIDGTCQCHLFKMYNKKIKTCVGLVGASCLIKEESVQCIENSSCIKRIVNSKSMSGKCSCNVGYVVSTNSTCQINVTKIDDVPIISFSVDVEVSEEKVEDNS